MEGIVHSFIIQSRKDVYLAKFSSVTITSGDRKVKGTSANVCLSQEKINLNMHYVPFFLKYYLLGNGNLDGPMISKCMPQLEQYIGIEPGKDLITELAACMEEFPSVKVRQICSPER